MLLILKKFKNYIRFNKILHFIFFQLFPLNYFIPSIIMTHFVVKL